MNRFVVVASAAAFGVVTLQAQTTVVNYSTGGTNVPGSAGYFNTGDGWTGGTAVWEGQTGGVGTAGSWTGSGVAGGAGGVANEAELTPSGINDNTGSLGYYDIPSDATVTLNRAFAPIVLNNLGVSFIAEWNLNPLVAPNGWDDSFVFDLRSGGASALSLTFQQVGVLNEYDMIAAGSSSSAWQQFRLSDTYRLQVDIAGTSWSATVYNVTDPTGARTISFNYAIPGGTLAGGFSATDIDNLQFSWLLDSGDPAQLGSLGMFVNEFTVMSTVIPEPATWAVGALLLSGAVSTIYRRRKARVARSAA